MEDKTLKDRLLSYYPSNSHKSMVYAFIINNYDLGDRFDVKEVERLGAEKGAWPNDPKELKRVGTQLHHMAYDTSLLRSGTTRKYTFRINPHWDGQRSSRPDGKAKDKDERKRQPRSPARKRKDGEWGEGDLLECVGPPLSDGRIIFRDAIDGGLHVMVEVDR